MSGHLGADTITLHVPTSIGKTTDKLGVPTKPTISVDLPGCSVQRLSQAETTSDIDAITTTRKVFCPGTSAAAAITSDYEVTWQGRRYHVHGDVDALTDLDGDLDHVRFVMKRTASGG